MFLITINRHFPALDHMGGGRPESVKHSAPARTITEALRLVVAARFSHCGEIPEIDPRAFSRRRFPARAEWSMNNGAQSIYVTIART